MTRIIRLEHLIWKNHETNPQLIKTLKDSKPKIEIKKIRIKIEIQNKFYL
jgi:hypothetical protein